MTQQMTHCYGKWSHNKWLIWSHDSTNDSLLFSESTTVWINTSKQLHELTLANCGFTVSLVSCFCLHKLVVYKDGGSNKAKMYFWKPNRQYLSIKQDFVHLEVKWHVESIQLWSFSLDAVQNRAN